MNRIQQAIRKRFVEAYYALKGKAFKNQKAFVKAMKWDQSTLSGMLTGKRPVPLKIVWVFCKRYSVSKSWVIDGTGEMFSEESKLTDLLKQLADHEQRLKQLERQISGGTQGGTKRYTKRVILS